VPGLTFDTGALIALEARRLTMRKAFHAAIANRVRITVPTVVLAEWWRAGVHEKERATLLRSVHVEDLAAHVAKLAGAALGQVRGATAIDAIVMASAALRGDAVYTSDPKDLEALRRAVPAFAKVLVLRV
jgi:predicted nucleic acid-binding protein